MAFNLSRMTVYALISAIEEDLRELIKIYLTNIEVSHLQINPELEMRAKSRIEKDIGTLFDGLDLKDLVDYFDLGDTFQTINANKESFPVHISTHIKSLTSKFESLVPIRNRVMHIRPLDVDDYPSVYSFCNELVGLDNLIWSNISTTLTKINTGNFQSSCRLDG
jgi:hypothetical protein